MDAEFMDFTRPRRYGRYVGAVKERDPGFITVEYRPPGFFNWLFNRTKRIFNVPQEGLVGPLSGPDYPTDGLYILIRSEGGYKGCVDHVVELADLKAPEVDRKVQKLELKARAATADRELADKAEKERLAELRERVMAPRKPRYEEEGEY